MFYIYRITNLIDGKTYIGKHEYKKLNDRYMGSGVHLRRAQKKYGMENFKKDILLFNISKLEQANLLEETFIAAEREKVGIENCYNESDGGDGGALFKGHHHSDIEKQKISKSLNKYYETHCGPNKGKHFGHPSEEVIKKRVEHNKGKHSKPLSEEHKRKLSEAGKGKPKTAEHKRHIAEALKNKTRPDDVKRKVSESLKASELTKDRHWFTNGKVNKLSKICPEGFYPGRTHK